MSKGWNSNEDNDHEPGTGSVGEFRKVRLGLFDDSIKEKEYMISSDYMRFKTHFLCIFFFSRVRKVNCLEATIRSKQKTSPIYLYASGQEMWEKKKKKSHHLRSLQGNLHS